MGSWIVAVLGGVMSWVGVPWHWDGSPECRLHIGDTAGPSSWDNEAHVMLTSDTSELANERRLFHKLQYCIA